MPVQLLIKYPAGKQAMAYVYVGLLPVSVKQKLLNKNNGTYSIDNYADEYVQNWDNTGIYFHSGRADMVLRVFSNAIRGILASLVDAIYTALHMVNQAFTKCRSIDSFLKLLTVRCSWNSFTSAQFI